LDSSTNSEKLRVIYINNTGDSGIYLIEFYISDNLKPYITMKESSLEDIGAGKQKSFDLEFFSPEEGFFQGDIRAKAVGDEGILVTKYLNLNLNFSLDYIPSEEPEQRQEIINEDEGGRINWKILGWLILIMVIVLVAVFFFKKYKGSKTKGIDLFKIARKSK
jgi:hypothetical protein